MLCSQSLNSDFCKNLITAVTWIVREAVGLLFIYSGFVKGVDVWGTVYKFQEYVSVFGFDISSNLILAGAFALCAYEFLTGIFLITGSYRRASTIMALAFMCVMLPLTLWIAISDPVADCGCFGDAFKISNWATFWKNVVLFTGTAWLIRYNKRIKCLITPAFQWMACVCSGVFILIICWYGYNVQPMIDFRPYKIGTALISDSDTGGDSGFMFVYSKDGKEQTFTEDSIPLEEDGWTFVRRRAVVREQSHTSTEGPDFRVLDKEGSEDVTSEAIIPEGSELLLLIPSVKDISASITYKINMLKSWADRHDIDMVAIVADNSGDIDEWIDLSMPDYEIYTADDTSIKELARGNPSVVYLEDGKIKWKTTLWSIDDALLEPEAAKVTKGGTRLSEFDSLAPEPRKWLSRMSWIYVCSLLALLVVSMIPLVYSRFSRRKDSVRESDRHSPV